MIYHETNFWAINGILLLLAAGLRILMYDKDKEQKGTTIAVFMVVLALCNTLYYYGFATQHHCAQIKRDAKVQEEKDIVVARKNWLEWQESNESRDDYTTLFYIDNNRNRQSINYVESKLN